MPHLASELASAVKQGNLARLNEILDTLEPDSARQLIDQELLLHLAATYNKPAVLSALLVRGASLSHSNALLHSPLQMAVMSGRAAIVSLLLEHQADPNQFSSISVEAIPSSIESQGVRRSNPPLILAIDSQQPAIVQRLLDARADVSRSLDSSGSTAVFHATMSGSLECLTALLRHAPPDSLDINATCGSRGTTALMAAVSNAGVDRARLLIEHRAAIHVRDGEGNTPLFHAARTGNKNAVLLLLKYGAETSITNVRRNLQPPKPSRAFTQPTRSLRLCVRNVDRRMMAEHQRSLRARLSSRSCSSHSVLECSPALCVWPFVQWLTALAPCESCSVVVGQPSTLVGTRELQGHRTHTRLAAARGTTRHSAGAAAERALVPSLVVYTIVSLRSIRQARVKRASMVTAAVVDGGSLLVLRLAQTRQALASDLELVLELEDRHLLVHDERLLLRGVLRQRVLLLLQRTARSVGFAGSLSGVDQ